MNDASKIERVLQLLKSKGTLRPKDLDSIDVPRGFLNKLYGEGILDRVRKGEYELIHTSPPRFPKMEEQDKKNVVPLAFAAYDGGFFGICYSVRLVGRQVIHCRSFQGLTLSLDSTIPSSDDWSRFLYRLLEIGVDRWQTSYPNPGVCDGSNWSLQFAFRDVAISCGGDNNYPNSDGSPNNSPEWTASYESLCDAIAELVGGTPFGPKNDRWGELTDEMEQEIKRIGLTFEEIKQIKSAAWHFGPDSAWHSIRRFELRKELRKKWLSRLREFHREKRKQTSLFVRESELTPEQSAEIRILSSKIDLIREWRYEKGLDIGLFTGPLAVLKYAMPRRPEEEDYWRFAFTMDELREWQKIYDVPKDSPTWFYHLHWEVREPRGNDSFWTPDIRALIPEGGKAMLGIQEKRNGGETWRLHRIVELWVIFPNQEPERLKTILDGWVDEECDQTTSTAQ